MYNYFIGKKLLDSLHLQGMQFKLNDILLELLLNLKRKIYLKNKKYKLLGSLLLQGGVCNRSNKMRKSSCTSFWTMHMRSCSS